MLSAVGFSRSDLFKGLLLGVACTTTLPALAVLFWLQRSKLARCMAMDRLLVTTQILRFHASRRLKLISSSQLQGTTSSTPLHHKSVMPSSRLLFMN